MDAGHVFDGGEVEDEDEEGSRLPLLLVIGLLVVAAFAGVVWLAYTQGVQRGRADAPRMLVAAAGPVKEAPANPGGATTPYTKLKIYQQPAPADEDDVESTPQPPTNVAPAEKAAAAVPIAKPVRVAQLPPQAAETAPAKPVETAPAATGEPAATRPPRSLLVPAAKPVAAPEKLVPPPAKAVKAAPKPVAVKPAPDATAPAAAEPASTDISGMALQIGAYKSEADANAAWASFSRKHPMAASYQPGVRKVDLGDKGIWYRLRMGTFPDKAAASAFCDKLKADGGTCFPAK